MGRSDQPPTRETPGWLGSRGQGDGASKTDSAHNEKATFTRDGQGRPPLSVTVASAAPALLRHSEEAVRGPGPWSGAARMRRHCVARFHLQSYPVPWLL